MARENNTVAKNFSRAVHSYEQEAVVQQYMAVELAKILRKGSIDQTKRVLEIGPGTGVFTREYLSCNSEILVDAVELSAGMRTIFQQNFPQNAGAMVAGLEGIESKYDLILSSCCLHWFDDLSELFFELRKRVNPHGQIVFSLMLEGTFRELVESVGLERKRKRVFQFPSLETLKLDLHSAGLKIQECRQERLFEAFPDFWEFMGSLRLRGVRVPSLNTLSFQFGPAELREMSRNYSRLASIQNLKESGGIRLSEANNGVFARYEVGYLVVSAAH